MLRTAEIKYFSDFLRGKGTAPESAFPGSTKGPVERYRRDKVQGLSPRNGKKPVRKECWKDESDGETSVSLGSSGPWHKGSTRDT